MIEEANREIWAAVSREISRRAERARLRLMIQSIDALLWEVEDLNLQDVRSVPRQLWDQIASVIGAATSVPVDAIPVRRSIGNALDVLFETQARLIAERRELLGLVPEEVWQAELADEAARYSRLEQPA